MKVGILDCDDIAPELIADYPSYAAMFEQLLNKVQSHDGHVEFEAYKVCQGKLPDSVFACDAYLITGSKVGVYDNVPWRTPIREFVRQAYSAGKQLVGFCFGHQLLADVLGGEARKSDKGWGIGVLTHQKQSNHALLGFIPEQLSLLYSHQDQVVILPPEARRLYGSEFCENGAFAIRNQVLSFQGHPEFTKQYSERLMRLREARYPPEVYNTGLASLGQETQELDVARWIWRFLTHTDELSLK